MTVRYELLPNSPAQANLLALKIYFLYRTAIYITYLNYGLESLSPDILNCPLLFNDPNPLHFRDTHGEALVYHAPLHHFAIKAALDTIKTWLNSHKNIKTYLAYEKVNDTESIVGFVHFHQTTGVHRTICIDQLGVSSRGKGIGKQLMEHVLLQHPAGTRFILDTRNFNQRAQKIYQSLGFTRVTQAFEHDPDRYCGFELTTTEAQLNALPRKQAIAQSAVFFSQTESPGAIVQHETSKLNKL